MKEDILYDAKNEHIDLPVKASDGIKDTQSVYGLENVSFGYASKYWGDLILKDNTTVKFVTTKSQYT